MNKKVISKLSSVILTLIVIIIGFGYDTIPAHAASTFYLDYVNGNNSNNGSNWTLAWRDLTSGATAARIAPGDTIRIAKSPDPVSIGNATWTNLSKTVTLATAQTLNVDMCETAWTASNGATVTRQGVATDAKEGSYCMQVAIDASPTTAQLQAYYAISSTNFSSYQKLSFWIKNEVAVTANQWQIALCSDNAGATAVDVFDIPAIPSTGRWLPLTLTKSGGGNLGNAIQSIALYTGSSAPTASKYLRLDDFIACTTSGLNLQSLISKNSLAQGGTEGWYGIQSINGTTVLLDNQTNTLANAGRGYYGTSETVTTYARETIKTSLASSSGTVVQEIQDSGTNGSLINFEGGYNTSSSTQDGETFFDGLNGNGYGIYLATKSYTNLNYISICRYSYGCAYSSSPNSQITTLTNANNNTTFGVYSNSSPNSKITTLSNANNNGSYGVSYSSTNSQITTLTNANNNGSYGVSYSDMGNNAITTLSNANNNGSYGVYYSNSNNNKIYALSTNSNGTSGVFNNTGTNYLYNATISEASEVSGLENFANSRIFSQNHDNGGYSKIFTDGGTINSQNVTRAGATGWEWKLDITSSNRHSGYPLILQTNPFKVEANRQVTVTAYFTKSHASNIQGRLAIRGGQIAGVTSDTFSSTTADNTNAQQLTLTFTPTAAGSVQIEYDAWYTGGNAYILVDTTVVTQ